MDNTQPQPPPAWSVELALIWRDLVQIRRDIAVARRDIAVEGPMNDELMGHLEQRVAAIEEVLAARGFRRLVLGRRLGRYLRSSVVPRDRMEGGWRARRTEYVGQTWNRK